MARVMNIGVDGGNISREGLAGGVSLEVEGLSLLVVVVALLLARDRIRSLLRQSPVAGVPVLFVGGTIQGIVGGASIAMKWVIPSSVAHSYWGSLSSRQLRVADLQQLGEYM